VAVCELVSDGSELSHQRRCVPSRLPGGAIVDVFGGDPFVDMFCEQ